MMDSGERPLWFFANLAEVKLTQQASGDRMSIVELWGPPGDMPPLHLHRSDDEAWVVLEGEVSFFIGSDEPVNVSTGEVAFGPKGVAHTYRVESGRPARWLAVCTPGEFAEFVVAASRIAERAELPPPPGPPTEDEVATITALAHAHGIELLGPPGALPGSGHAH
jgi:mannose-6-phosphate isomerase-like protein (cupin superfamily)